MKGHVLSFKLSRDFSDHLDDYFLKKQIIDKLVKIVD